MVATQMFKLPAPGAFRSVLRHLDTEAIGRLCLRPVHFQAGKTIGCRGKEMHHIAFLETGAASLMVSFENGRQAEAAFLDSESIVGLTALFGDTTYLQDVVMQVAGAGYLCRRENALQEFARCQGLQRLALESARSQMAETAQLAGCYATHEVSQRLARWLLTFKDRTGYEVIAITQEVLSQMLGATRSTIGVTSALFERHGLIEVRRGKIRLLDRPALEAEACDCYGALRDYRRRDSRAICRLPHKVPGNPGLTSANGPFCAKSGTLGRAGFRRSDNHVQ